VCIEAVAGGARQCGSLGEPVTVLSFASERLLVAGGRGGTIRSWDGVTWQERGTLHHDSEVTTIAVTPDGRHVAAGADTGSVRIWTIDDQVEVARIDHDGRVAGLAFVSDGRYLLSASVDGTARLSWWLPADLFAEACARLGPGRGSDASAPDAGIDRVALCGNTRGSAVGAASLPPLTPN
jgi:WD40 repeat protein